MEGRSHGATYFGLSLILIIGACSSGSTSPPAGFNVDWPSSLNQLKIDALRVSGAAYDPRRVDKGGQNKLISAERDTTRTIKGNYALPVGGLAAGAEYEFRLKIYYQADAYSVPQLRNTSALEATLEPIGISTNFALCPGLSLTPDGSLVENNWLLLCEVSVVAPYDSRALIKVSETQIICSNHDADGDGMANLDEIDLHVNPFNGDFDQDCVPDALDDFPKDETESRDTDGDGVGDEADLDADNDGLSDETEETLGSDPRDNDTDDDGVSDGSDRCPLNASADRTDTDADGRGNICDADDDGDGLSDSDELVLGTNPLSTDSDGDGWSDQKEVEEGTGANTADSDGDGVGDSVDFFPLNRLESSDTDGDGLGDHGDNCPTVVNASQDNIDGDGLGDACDSDSDNDGLTDDMENKIGSNPFQSDTDGDGLTDWFGGEKASGQDGCLLLGSQSPIDQDDDGFNVACDCDDTDNEIHPARADQPDVDGLDEDCDGIDGDEDDAIFVSITQGDDSNDGSRTSPFKSIAVAGLWAQLSGRDVYIADGVYTLSDTYSLPTGVMFYGGFGNNYVVRDIEGTVIRSETLEVLIEAIATGEGTGLDGLTIENDLTSAGTPVALMLRNAELEIANSEIVVSNTLHALAMDMADSQVTMRDNAIEVSGGSGTGVGLLIMDVFGSFSGNTLEIRDFASRVGIRCLSTGSEDLELTDNRIDLWSDPTLASSSLVYIQDCGGTLHFTLPAGFPVNDSISVDGYAGFIDGGGNRLGSLF